MPRKGFSVDRSNNRKTGRGTVWALAAVALMVASPAQGEAASDDLLMRKCTSCHTAVRWQSARHTRIGWWAVTSRMRWIHGASLSWSEQAEAVDLLVARFPATNDEARDEWLLILLSAVTVLLLAGGWVCRLKRFRRLFSRH